MIFWCGLKISSENHSKRGISEMYTAVTPSREWKLFLKMAARWLILFHASIPLYMLFGPLAWSTTFSSPPCLPEYSNSSLPSKSPPPGSLPGVPRLMQMLLSHCHPPLSWAEQYVKDIKNTGFVFCTPPHLPLPSCQLLTNNGCIFWYLTEWWLHTMLHKCLLPK